MSERRIVLALVVTLAATAFACGHRGGPAVSTVTGSAGDGLASWYGEPYHGRRTASGEIYDMHGFTAAHRSLDFGTWVRVTRRDTGQSVTVRVNDRGPFVSGRVIDLSYGAARTIGLDLDGLAAVDVEVLNGPPRQLPETTVEPVPIPAPDGECLWVQVGAFGSTDNAERARDRLRDSGERVLLMEGPQGLDRVRVGPYTDRSKAEAALERLRPDWPPAKIGECGG